MLPRADDALDNPPGIRVFDPYSLAQRPIHERLAAHLNRHAAAGNCQCNGLAPLHRDIGLQNGRSEYATRKQLGLHALADELSGVRYIPLRQA